jgi:hypothetical protein
MKKYRLKDLLEEIKKDEQLEKSSYGKKLTQSQIRKVLSSLRQKDSQEDEK